MARKAEGFGNGPTVAAKARLPRSFRLGRELSVVPPSFAAYSRRLRKQVPETLRALEMGPREPR